MAVDVAPTNLALELPASRSLGSSATRTSSGTSESIVGKLAWMLLAVVPLVAVAQSSGMGLIDAWWNVGLGQLMLRQHQLVTTDPYSFTPTVASAINQQWLAQLVLGAAYETAGQLGPLALRALAVAVTALSLWVTGRDLGASRRALVAASLLSGCLIASNLTVRAQTLVFPIAALSLLVLQRGGRVAWLVVPLTVLWANTHGSFPVAVALTGAFAVGSLVTGTPKQAFSYTALTLATALATLVTPYGLDAWRYAIDLSSNDALRNAIAEWAPTTVDSLTGKTFFIEIAAACMLLAWRRPRVPLTWLLLAAGLSVIGLTAVRNVVWLGIVALPVWAVMLDHAFGIFRDHPTRPRMVVLMVIALASLALLPSFSGRVQLPSQHASDVEAVDRELALSDLASYLIAHPDAHLFSDADWGAYLEAHIGPEQKVFVDTRYEVHQPAVWDDYLAVVSGRYDWEPILGRYGVDRIAVDPDRTPILAQALDSSAGWQRVWRTDHDTEHVVVWDRAAAS
jgi:hypothetical protein